MRITLPVVLLLFTVTTAQGQAQTSAAPVGAAVPAPAEVPAAPAPAVAVAPADVPARPADAVAPAEAARPAAEARAEEPTRKSRAVWFLVGAVVVLGIVLAATL
jgi:hypothetical protein